MAAEAISDKAKAFHEVTPPLAKGTLNALTEMGFADLMTPVQVRKNWEKNMALPSYVL